MPFCPHCKSEYEAGVALCSECGASLVDKLPTIVEADPNITLVEVWRAQGEIDAQLVRSMLEASGVECMLSGESVRLTHAMTVDGLAEVKILVRESDEPRAREVLSSSEHTRECLACGAFNPVDTAACRFCGEAIV